MKLTEYNITANGAGSLRLAVVSDLHDRKNAPIMERLKKLAPDAILVPGDFIHNSEIYERGIEFLRLAAAYRPTFCSLGNHESKHGGDVKAMVAPTGAILLDNSSYFFKGLVLGGLTTGYKPGAPQSRTGDTPEPDLAWLQKFSLLDGFKILLCHHPEYYDRYIKHLPIDIILSGHAHGGQWQFFGKGVFAPGQGLFPKYTYGIHDGRFIISRGVGNKYPVPRINNPTELIILNINKDNKNQ